MRLKLHYGDLTDSTNLIRIIQEVQPDEIYNLAAQSHVAVSFETPEYTANSDALGTLRVLEAIPSGLEQEDPFLPGVHLGNVWQGGGDPRNARAPLSIRGRPMGSPRSTPTGSHVNYREAYGLYACNGILFNHESPLPGARRSCRARSPAH